MECIFKRDLLKLYSPLYRPRFKRRINYDYFHTIHVEREIAPVIKLYKSSFAHPPKSCQNTSPSLVLQIFECRNFLCRIKTSGRIAYI